MARLMMKTLTRDGWVDAAVVERPWRRRRQRRRTASRAMTATLPMSVRTIRATMVATRCVTSGVQISPCFSLFSSNPPTSLQFPAVSDVTFRTDVGAMLSSESITAAAQTHTYHHHHHHYHRRLYTSTAVSIMNFFPGKAIPVHFLIAVNYRTLYQLVKRIGNMTIFNSTEMVTSVCLSLLVFTQLFFESCTVGTSQTCAKQNLTRNSHSRSFKVTHFEITVKPTTNYVSLYDNAGLICKVSEKQPAKTLKMAIADNPTVV